MEKDGPDVEKVQNATGSSPTDLSISESKTTSPSPSPSTSPSLISFETTTTTTIDKEDVVAVTMKIIPADTTVVGSIVTSPVSGGADSTVTAEPEANQTRMPEKTTARAPRAEKGDVFVTSASSSTTTAAPATNTERTTEEMEAVTGRRVVQAAATAAAEITARTTTQSPFFGGLSEETTEMMMDDDYYEDVGTRMGGAAVGKPSLTVPSRQDLGAFGDNEHGIKVRTVYWKVYFQVFIHKFFLSRHSTKKTLLLKFPDFTIVIYIKILLL